MVYCTDTGICNNLYDLSVKADLSITKCAHRSGQKNEQRPHLNPEEAAGLAKAAQVKKVALIHFDAHLYPTLKDRLEAQRQARTIFKSSFALRDDQIMEL